MYRWFALGQRSRIRSASDQGGGKHMLADSYPLLNVIWTIIVFFFFLSIWVAVIWAFIDNFRRRDHSGWAKAGWALVIIILPFMCTLIYLIARPAEPAV